MTICIPDIQHINIAARDLLSLCKNRFFFAFYGDLGAGKTTFIKAICEALGSPDHIASPTFSLVNEYHFPDASSKLRNIYHMDFYRLKSISEALDIGVVDYFQHPGSYCFIEWPEIVESLLPENTVRVRITTNSDRSRTVNIE